MSLVRYSAGNSGPHTVASSWLFRLKLRRLRSGRASRRKRAVGSVVTVKMLIVDDHKLLRAGLASVLCTDPDLEVAGQCPDGRAAVDSPDSYIRRWS